MEAPRIDWTVFSLVLAGELLFALLVAYITRLVASHKLTGQTYWLVVVGVGGVVVISGPVIGWQAVIILGACFSVAGLPMGVEYFGRLLAEHKAAQAAREELVK